MTKSSRLVSTFLFLVLVLSACNLPPGGTQEQNGGGNASAVLTAAAQTVEASLTETAAQNTPTVAVIPTSTVAPPTVTLAAASPTLNVPAATATQDCDNADFVTDVTIPDGTVLNPNESFTKTWRLKNSGTCSWTPSYAVVFESGDSMSGPSTQALTGNVNPGQTMDISVDLKAPATPGDPFAVTSVDLSVSGGCGNFQIQADITTNGAGTVTYKWIRSDGATDTVTHPDLVFNSAGTKSVTTSWSTTASGAKWMDIYIDKPNHQQFGRANFSCP